MSLGAGSLAQLGTCDLRLQVLIKAVAKGIDEGDLAYAGIHDLKVTCGWRGKLDQNAAFARGDSKVQWPNSAHNETPARAVDVVPFPELWSDVRKLEILHAYICGVAHALGIDLRDISWDRPHVELAK